MWEEYRDVQHLFTTQVEVQLLLLVLLKSYTFAHVSLVYSDERLGACAIKPCHDQIALFSVCESKQ